jgi:hypothetical protein
VLASGLCTSAALAGQTAVFGGYHGAPDAVRPAVRPMPCALPWHVQHNVMTLGSSSLPPWDRGLMW